MHLEDNAYNWYLWWKNTARICSYNWVSFRNNLIKRFQGVEEKDFFCQNHKVTTKKQCRWVHLWMGSTVNSSPRVNWWPITIDLHTRSKKPHPWQTRVTQNLYHEEARRKARIIESKFVHTNVDQDDSKKNPLQSGYIGNPRYTPPQLREGTKPNLEA